MLFFTHFSRNASDIAAEQIRNTPSRSSDLKRMHEMVGQAMEILNGRTEDLAKMGRLLHDSWQIKRGLSKLITTPYIDEIYQAALDAGALGGKLLGAGGGGFILFFVPPEAQPRIKERLKQLLYVPFRFESLGSQIILYAPQDFF